MDSFISNKWPCDYIQPAELALFGFFYFQRYDIVRCHFCKITIGNWMKSDKVLNEHEKWAPHCPFLLRKKTNNIPIDANLLDSKLPPLSIDECGIYSAREIVPAYNFLCFRNESFEKWLNELKKHCEKLARKNLYIHEDKLYCNTCSKIILVDLINIMNIDKLLEHRCT